MLRSKAAVPDCDADARAEAGLDGPGARTVTQDLLDQAGSACPRRRDQVNTRTGGVGIIGVIVIVLIVLFVVGKL